ncbi:MAG TPA: type II toxin-antitoxin system YhaV family toxin [Azospirillaceae bacterium]|nr:type II toxin-antitoxin system YhaV family toxin [Azospirillaceae bacterium]
MSGPIEVNGWRLLLHPRFREIYGPLADEVERLSERDPAGTAAHPKAKLLKRVDALIYGEIPQDPGAPQFRQGRTLGPEFKHWRRAKFFQRFRLFYRYDSASRTIIYAWINDENSLRKAGAKSDPYEVFRRMVLGGDPPDDWDALLRATERDAP